MNDLQKLEIWQNRFNNLVKFSKENCYITTQITEMCYELDARIFRLNAAIEKAAKQSIVNHFAALANLKFD